jgi:hypothetical protein
MKPLTTSDNQTYSGPVPLDAAFMSLVQSCSFATAWESAQGFIALRDTLRGLVTVGGDRPRRSLRGSRP